MRIEPRTYNKCVHHAFFRLCRRDGTNSKQRHAARRKRREEKREEKRIAYNKPYDNYEAVIDANALIVAAKMSAKGVRWKASTQKFMANLLRGIWELRKKLKNGVSIVMGFICFVIRERGKTRAIRSVHFKERVVQRSTCDNALIPVLKRGLVYDNGASMEGKGIHFALFRLKRQLLRYFRLYGTNEGWILQIDFSGYFDNILHKPVKDIIVRNFKDRRLRWLIWQFVKSFGEKSLGIGSQVSQILAVAYPSRIDHFIKEVLRIGLSGRYMDDSYLIHHSKEYLEECLERMKPLFSELGIAFNPRKTQIIPLKRFTFLKVRFNLTDSGRVVMKPHKPSFTRMRGKLRHFKEDYVAGKMTLQGVESAYQSWYGYHKHTDSHDSLHSMDVYFHDLFGVWPKHKKKKGKKKKL